MATIHFNAQNEIGQYILIDLAEVQALWTEPDGEVTLQMKGGNRCTMHGGALPGLLAAMDEYRKLNGIVLMPNER